MGDVNLTYGCVPVPSSSSFSSSDAKHRAGPGCWDRDALELDFPGGDSGAVKRGERRQMPPFPSFHRLTVPAPHPRGSADWPPVHPQPISVRHRPSLTNETAPPLPLPRFPMSVAANETGGGETRAAFAAKRIWRAKKARRSRLYRTIRAVGAVLAARS